MKPIIELDFSKPMGIIADPTLQIGNGFSFVQQVDFAAKPGYLRSGILAAVMPEAAATDNITDIVRWIREYSGSDAATSSKKYGLSENGRIYEYDSVAIKWSRTATDGNASNGQGLEPFADHLYYASDSFLGRVSRSAGEVHFNHSFQALETDTDLHPMKVYAGKLCIGAGRYIATWDNTIFTAQALTLPVGYLVKSLEVFGDRLMIGAKVPGETKGMLFTWDGDPNHTYEQALEIGETQISAMAVWEGLLWLGSGDKGILYVYNGARVSKAVQLPGDYEGALFGEMYPDAMKVYKNKLLVGIHKTTGDNERGGIYALEKINPSDPLMLTLAYMCSENDLDARYYSIYPLRDQILFSKRQGSTYGIDELDTARRKVALAIVESEVYEVKKGNQPRLIKGIRIEAKTLSSSAPVNTVVIKYKIDNDSSWTTLGTFTSTNQTTMLRILKRARKFQLRIEITADVLYTGTAEVSKVLIF